MIYVPKDATLFPTFRRAGRCIISVWYWGWKEGIFGMILSASVILTIAGGMFHLIVRKEAKNDAIYERRCVARLSQAPTMADSIVIADKRRECWKYIP